MVENNINKIYLKERSIVFFFSFFFEKKKEKVALLSLFFCEKYKTYIDEISRA
jgi:hypothetical protein